jgi:hypothetical protein
MTPFRRLLDLASLSQRSMAWRIISRALETIGMYFSHSFVMKQP